MHGRSSPTPTDSRGKDRRWLSACPWGLLGCVLCVALVERELNRHALALTPNDTFSWAYSSREASSPARRSSLLCLGSSMSLSGVVPSALEQGSGRACRNLAVTFGAPAAQAVLLERVLETGSTPEAVFLEVPPRALSEGPRFATRFWPELLGLGEAFRFTWSAREPLLLLELVVNEALPSLRWRAGLRARIPRALRAEPDNEAFANVVAARNRRRNGGALLLPFVTHDGSIPPSALAGHLPRSWTPLPWNLAWIEHAIGLAEGRGIPVFWHIPPFCPELIEARMDRGLEAEYDRMLLDVLDRHPGLTVIDARWSGFGNTELHDALHLNRRGAVAYSLALGRIARERLERKAPAAPARWVALPRFEPADDSGLEDLPASAVALWSSGASKPARRTR